MGIEPETDRKASSGRNNSKESSFAMSTAHPGDPRDELVDPLAAIEDWPANNKAAALSRANGIVQIKGDTDFVFQWASVTKLLTCLAVLVAVEEGTIALDESAGPPGSTVRHLLSHASGLGPGIPAAASGRPASGYRSAEDRQHATVPVGTRRIYSNTGFEALAILLEDRAAIDFRNYLAEGVLQPLGLSSVSLRGSPAWGASGTIGDLIRLAIEFQNPRLIARETLDEATKVTFPGLPGVLPGFGLMETNDWGLGFEIKDSKRPHWTGRTNSPATFGHFGQSGSFLWVDPIAGVACASLADKPFGSWAVECWPELSDLVLESVVSSE